MCLRLAVFPNNALSSGHEIKSGSPTNWQNQAPKQTNQWTTTSTPARGMSLLLWFVWLWLLFCEAMSKHIPLWKQHTVNFRKYDGGLYVRSVPGNKVHAVCKMHRTKCARIVGWNMVSQLISRHGPDLVLFCSFLYWSLQCNLVLFFCRQKSRGLLNRICSMNLKKRPAAGATFQCFDRRQKELIPSIWNPFKNRRYIFKQKHVVIISFFHFFHVLYCLFSSFHFF